MDTLVRTTEEGGLNFRCDLCDSEVVRSMTELLLRGLATASVDSTTGDIFKSPSSVAVGMGTELADYLIQRSETLVHESLDGAFPQGTLDKHCSGLLQTHLLCVLQVITRQDASVSGMNQLLEKAQSLNELSGALDVRSLTGSL